MCMCNVYRTYLLARQCMFFSNKITFGNFVRIHHITVPTYDCDKSLLNKSPSFFYPYENVSVTVTQTYSPRHHAVVSIVYYGRLICRWFATFDSYEVTTDHVHVYLQNLIKNRSITQLTNHPLSNYPKVSTSKEYDLILYIFMPCTLRARH